LWIDNIRIEIDGKDIGPYTELELLEPIHINPENIIPIEDASSFARIPALNEKKIVAIGESLHGSETFDELFYETVKYQVQHNQCKLILLELDMSTTFAMNSFIQGNENFDADSLLYDLRYISYSYRQLKKTLLFLKDYNRSTEKKVHLIGIDIGIPSGVVVLPRFYPSEYLYMLNSDFNYKKIDTICYELRVTNAYTNPVGIELQKLEKDARFRQMLGETELKIFSYCINNYMKKFADKANIDLTAHPALRKEYEISREIWMFENAKHFIDLICGQNSDGKVLIFGHAAHLGLRTDGYVPIMISIFIMN